MDSSDDEGVVSPQAVSGYHFEDAESRPISFADLPVQWSEEANGDCAGKEIYLRGTADNGLLTVLRQVTAWKYNISLAKPEISVLSKDNNWIKLEKPRKIFEEIIRTILITVHCLHFVKRNPDAPEKALWDRLSRVFSLYDPRPSKNDLIDHIDFIGEAVKRDEVLAKSKFLAAFLEEKPRKRKAVYESKLGVYPAPFLHGMRYTSFGRHFTKVEKLKEIVDILHWYVKEGDTIVDFCCGANDFSSIMKMKLDEVGKQCSYKNYDVLQAKNDFNFEKRDWMTVQPQELPPGSQLIMGLNPPSGVNASLANMFVDKALQFKPKLIILIVPPETERLDRKHPPYDQVWEDAVLLAGKSFFLPGSVDTSLYLWSRQDWTSKHKAIAEQHGHTSRLEHDSGTVIDAPMKHEV